MLLLLLIQPKKLFMDDYENNVINANANITHQWLNASNGQNIAAESSC